MYIAVGALHVRSDEQREECRAENEQTARSNEHPPARFVITDSLQRQDPRYRNQRQAAFQIPPEDQTVTSLHRDACPIVIEIVEEKQKPHGKGTEIAEDAEGGDDVPILHRFSFPQRGEQSDQHRQQTHERKPKGRCAAVKEPANDRLSQHSQTFGGKHSPRAGMEDLRERVVLKLHATENRRLFPLCQEMVGHQRQYETCGIKRKMDRLRPAFSFPIHDKHRERGGSDDHDSPLVRHIGVDCSQRKQRAEQLSPQGGQIAAVQGQQQMKNDPRDQE